ncbi:MAG TPA: hypothetical protein ENI99_03375 [Sedimenticola sp.]|nr:hypothetical protein [Sedimenticola sp.]
MHPRLLSLLIFITLITGCASVSYLPVDKSITYPPTDNLEVFWKEPNKNYKIIGKISVESGDLGEEELFEELKNKAMAVGAHAIIMGGTSKQSSVVGTPVYGGGTVIVPVTETRLEAIAIRFDDAGQP